MTRVPKRPRLNLPRDLEVAYTLGRMGVARVSDLFPLYWGDLSTARFGFRRLVGLDLVRSFERNAPSDERWFSLTPKGIAWVATETGCDEDELRAHAGIRRLNLDAIAMRNRLWAALIIASRTSSEAKLSLFVDERELRRRKAPECSVVPDALFVLVSRASSSTTASFFVELDSGSERAAEWAKKAAAYREAMDRGPLYTVADWRIISIVPSLRRATMIAKVVVSVGIGTLMYFTTMAALGGGHGFDHVLWRSDALGAGQERPAHTFIQGLGLKVCRKMCAAWGP